MAKGPYDKGGAMPAAKNLKGGVVKAPKAKKEAPVSVGTSGYLPKKSK